MANHNCIDTKVRSPARNAAATSMPPAPTLVFAIPPHHSWTEGNVADGVQEGEASKECRQAIEGHLVAEYAPSVVRSDGESGLRPELRGKGPRASSPMAAKAKRF